MEGRIYLAVELVVQFVEEEEEEEEENEMSS